MDRSTSTRKSRMIKGSLSSIVPVLKGTHGVRSAGAVLAAAALLAGVASGCGGSASDEAEAEVPPTVQAGTSDDTSTSGTTGLVENDTATVDSSTGEEAATGPQPLPAAAQALALGEYMTSMYAPAFSFVVDQPAATPGELPNVVALNLGTGGEETFLTFLNDSIMLLDPKSEHDADSSPDIDDVVVISPESLVTWLTKHPRLDVSEPEEVTIGGVPATEVTVEIARGEGYESVNCNPGVECVLLVGTPQFAYWAEVGRPIRFQVLETDGRTVAILTEPPSAKPDAGIALADQLLATVAFG